MLDDVDLDHAIDEVAREITGARVDENFARRVAALIENAAVHATPRWSSRWLLVPAAAGVLLLAVFLIHDERSPSSVRPTSSAKATAVKKPDAVEAHTTTNASAATAGVATGAERAAVVARATEPTSVVAPRAGLSPVAPADPDLRPLTTAPIEVAAIDISPQLGVMPIEISAIAIDRIEISSMP